MPRNLFEHEMSDLKGSLVDLGISLIRLSLTHSRCCASQIRKPPPQSHGGKKP